jgi:hypothetical protein
MGTAMKSRRNAVAKASATPKPTVDRPIPNSSQVPARASASRGRQALKKARVRTPASRTARYV